MDKEHKFEWLIEKIDATHPTASLEMKTTCEADSLFPFEVKLSSPYSILGAKILKVQTADTKQPITHSEKTMLSCDNYQIVLEL